VVSSEVCDNVVWSSLTTTHSLEATMGSKDKGGKNTKTVPAKDLKQKRLDKQAKRTAASDKQSRAT
jgi:hypothetical protein